MNIEQRVSPNKNAGRSGWKPDIIVCHITDGSYAGAVSWLCNKDSGVSAHFVVSKNGDVVQLVPLTDTAWCNGTSTNPSDSRYYGASRLSAVRERKTNANYYTIGIEHEGISSQTNGRLTDLQQAASVDLIKHIRSEVKKIFNTEIPLCRTNIVGHCDVTPKWKPNCPGRDFQFDEIIRLLSYDAALDALVSAGVIASPEYWRSNINSLQYLDMLIQTASAKVNATTNNGITDANDALNRLKAAGVMQSPEYWSERLDKLQYLRQLIINIANHVPISG